MGLRKLFLLVIISVCVGCTAKPETEDVSLKNDPLPTLEPDASPDEIEAFAFDQQQVEDSRAIAALISTEAPLPAGQLQVQIAYNDGTFATGTLSHTYPEAVKGKMWLTAKQEGDWKLVHYGSPAIPCEVASSYEVPVDLVQVCIATPSGEMIQR